MVRQDSHSTSVRAVTPADAGAVAAIYNHYVLQTVVTFEEEPITAAEISRRIDEVRAGSLPWFVANVPALLRDTPMRRDGGRGPPIGSRLRSRSILPRSRGGEVSEPRSTPSSFPRFERVAFTPRSEASPFPTTPASPFMKSSGSRKSHTSNRRVSSSIAGLMSGIGS